MFYWSWFVFTDQCWEYTQIYFCNFSHWADVITGVVLHDWFSVICTTLNVYEQFLRWLKFTIYTNLKFIHFPVQTECKSKRFVRN